MTDVDYTPRRIIMRVKNAVKAAWKEKSLNVYVENSTDPENQFVLLNFAINRVQSINVIETIRETSVRLMRHGTEEISPEYKGADIEKALRTLVSKHFDDMRVNILWTGNSEMPDDYKMAIVSALNVPMTMVRFVTTETLCQIGAGLDDTSIISPARLSMNYTKQADAIAFEQNGFIYMIEQPLMNSIRETLEIPSVNDYDCYKGLTQVISL